MANWRWHEMACMVGPHFSIRLGENLGLIHVHTALLHARSRVGEALGLTKKAVKQCPPRPSHSFFSTS